MTVKRVKQSLPLIRQLLFSHLSVALIGLGMLAIALAATYDLRGRVIQLAKESGPMTRASFQLLTGIRNSSANLHGWANLGDQRFLTGWQAAWRDEIQPALESLKKCPPLSEPICNSKRIEELRSLLADLQESQWWVRDQVRTPGNEPARLLYSREIEPNAQKLHSLLLALFEDEKERTGGTERKKLLARIGEIQRQFSTAHLLLREILGATGPNYITPFNEHLRVVQSETDGLAADALLEPEQRQLSDRFQQELKTFAVRADELIRLRQQVGWNIALQTMVQETDPLTDQVIALANAIAKQAETRLEGEILAAQAASAITVWSLILMIAVMLVIAYVLSQKRAEALSQPITSLVEATRKLAAGGLHEDIPVSGSDELGELTRSFNSLRASMQGAQEKLREANTLLEQRVAERTADLETVNQALTHEIVTRNQTEIALRESEARLRAMTRAIPDLVFVVDEDGRYREILAAGPGRTATGIAPTSDASPNPMPAAEPHRFRETPTAGPKPVTIGMTPIRDRLLHEVHSPEMADFFLDIIHRALATQQIQVAEYELQTASGLRWFESRTAPLDVEFDARATAIVVAHDITKRKQAEVQLRQAQKMQAIGQLTGGIAHDFNNLLAVIMGNLELLNEQLVVQPRLHELAQQALKAVDRGTYLTRRLLAFSRHQPLLAQPTDLNKLVLGMLDLMRRTLGATIQIDTMLANDLHLTLVDPDQLESALLNLVINARDAMAQGGKLTLETANIVIEEEYAEPQADMQPGPYVLLAVSDTGAGMSPKVLERAFEPFFTTKESGKGSGLGLSIVYGLVKQSGGHITIHSQLDQGTTVRLYLPSIETSVQPVAEQHTVDTSIKGRGETILVVEDDPGVRLFAVNALRGLGYKPVQAEDAAAALQVLETTPDILLLFTDIVMPGEMDGVKLAEEAQRRYPHLRVLYTSGYTEHALIGNGHQVAGVEVLTKPYRKADLGKKLRLLLSLRE
ncbi:MAG TPA: ATP-binding protein [Candidatus Competibacter sp.]|nr:response regulator [Candidatus Competibacter sp.]HRX59632.1 ATP-binding protein [Candidatus Competibacter sp.]